MMKTVFRLVCACTVLALAVGPSAAQERSDKKRAKALEKAAVIEKKIMVPMRDGVRLATDVYRPAEAEKPVPTIFCGGRPLRRHRPPYSPVNE